MERRGYTTASIESMLISPIQRVTRYQLLFGEYRKVCVAEGDILGRKKIDTLLLGFEEMVSHIDRNTRINF